MTPLFRHPRESGSPSPDWPARDMGRSWVPAFAGMTEKK